MIDVQDLYFSYSKYEDFIKQLNIYFEEEKITTILGPNGSGKSTLLNLIANVTKPKGGTILIDGKKISTLGRKEIAKEMASVFQQNSAPEDITVYELVSYGRTPHKRYFEGLNREDEEIIKWAMDSTAISHLKDRNFSSLSGGERQRVWVAMALVQKTKILLLDEPTTYLDIHHQIEILNLIKKINKELNLTIIMVLHDINQAIKYSDNVVVMNNGKIAQYGKPKNIITQELIEEVYKVSVEIVYDFLGEDIFLIFKEKI
ncbi:MAG: ABC transporter ATP-binding protein [Candidatus Omnitrophica bacterium]|nr:ABC transporter ATP-binding protein [Candidatus Omnitrophota bacterium]